MSEEIEIWKDIPDYEGYYQVSNWGRVKALSIVYSSGVNGRSIKTKPEKFMRCRVGKDGYCRTMITKDRVRKSYLIHRLVAIAFVNNTEGLPEVNHADGNKTNNHSNNLEWCFRNYNIQHAVRTGLKVARSGGESHTAKKVNQCDSDGNVIKEWACIKEASEALNIGAQSITHVLKGRWAQAYGYKWVYA